MEKEQRKKIRLEIEEFRKKKEEKRLKKLSKKKIKIIKIEAKVIKNNQSEKQRKDYQKQYYIKKTKFKRLKNKKLKLAKIKPAKIKILTIKVKDTKPVLTTTERRHKNNTWVKEKRKSCPQFRIARALRSRLSMAIKRNSKVGSAVRDLGCSLDYLKLYLEERFSVDMKWDNYGAGEGKWSIDHIIPLSMVDLTNVDDFKKVNHYTNLRPLWNKDQLIMYHKVQKKLTQY